jgi:hypothetical protein
MSRGQRDTIRKKDSRRGKDIRWRFADWLESLAPVGHGQQRKITERTGLSAAYISRVFRRRAPGHPQGPYDPQLSTLHDVALYQHRSAWELVRELEGAAPVSTHTVACKTRELADFLAGLRARFEANPHLFAVARELLGAHADEPLAGYPELLAGIAEAVLESGPSKAAPGVVQLLVQHRDTAADARRRTRAAR